MAGPALTYEYRYQHASTLEGTLGGADLRLATCSERGEPHPHFFHGRLLRPGRAAELLRGLFDVVQARFYLPSAMLARIPGLADPVVTGSGDLLRFEAARSLRSLPKGSATTSGWVVSSGRGLRLSQVAARGGIRVGGVQRLHILDDLARHAQTLRIYADEQNQASAWELVLDEARFTLALSPDVSRGFSAIAVHPG